MVAIVYGWRNEEANAASNPSQRRAEQAMPCALVYDGREAFRSRGKGGPRRNVSGGRLAATGRKPHRNFFAMSPKGALQKRRTSETN